MILNIEGVSDVLAVSLKSRMIIYKTSMCMFVVKHFRM